MGIFDLFKKKENGELIKEMIAFSKQALDFASSSIEEHGTFLPFGAVLTKEGTVQLIVYHDPEKESVDPREHATVIQQLIAKKYEDPNCEICHMAFDGISHLKTGDMDSINVRVSHKPTNTHKLISYTYVLTDGKIHILNLDNPMVSGI